MTPAIFRTAEQLPSARPVRRTEPRPLMPVSAVMWRLDLDEDEILLLIEDGTLPWCFDIATSPDKRCIRVLSESVEDLVNRQKRQPLAPEAEWERVSSLVLPKTETAVLGDIARALNCCRALVMAFIRAKHFGLAPGSLIRRGPGGSPHIQVASVKSWLEKRRVH